MEPTTVYQTLNIAQADMICAHLQSAGFEARLSHDLATLSMEGYALAPGGVMIKVPAHEAEEARAFIADLEKQP